MIRPRDESGIAETLPSMPRRVLGERPWGTTVAVAVVILATVAMLGGVSAALSIDEGEGTPEDPYVITDVDDLQAMQDDLEGHYVLGNDIDASATEDWNDEGDGPLGFDPVGDADEPFTGSLDGNGYAITDLTVNRTDEDEVGLFGYIEAGTVKDVHLEQVNVTGNQQDDSQRVGGLAGRAVESTVSGVEVTGTVTGHSDDTFSATGGVLGRQDGGVVEDVTAVDIQVTGDWRVGGLVGYITDGDLLESSVSGTVTVTGEDGRANLGGAVGYQADGVIADVSAATDVTAPDTSAVGGLVGLLDGEIRDSQATGAVSARTDVGGLVGNVMGTADEYSVVRSNATGQVSGDGQRIGGLAGRLQTGVVRETHAEGGVSGETDDGKVGGLVGENDGVINDSYAIGDVYGERGPVGGLVGWSDGEIHESHASGDVTASQGTAGGLAGLVRDDVTRSHASGDVVALSGSDRVGGFAGRLNGGTIEDSYSTGDVLSMAGGEVFVGGFIGQINQDSDVIAGSYATGNVTQEGSDEAFVGGFVGMNGRPLASGAGGQIEATYAAGEITAAAGSTVGGFAGENDPDSSPGIVDSYWDVPAAGLTGSVGVGDDGGVEGLGDVEDVPPADEMTGDDAPDNMDAFDFVNVWKTTDVYPELRSESDEPEPQPDISVVDASVSETTVEEGNSVTVTADAENAGDATGEYTASLEVDSDVEDEETFTVDAGETETVEFTHTFDEAGEFDVTVDGVEAGTVTVEEADEPEPTPTPTPTPTPEPRPTPAPSPEPEPETSVSVEVIDDGVAVSVANARALEPVGLPVSTGVGGVALDGLTVTTAVDADYELTVTPGTELSDESHPHPGEWEPLLVLDVDQTLAPEQVDTATFEFVVTRDELEALDAGGPDVVLYHDVDGEWVERETEVGSFPDDYWDELEEPADLFPGDNWAEAGVDDPDALFPGDNWEEAESLDDLFPGDNWEEAESPEDLFPGDNWEEAGVENPEALFPGDNWEEAESPTDLFPGDNWDTVKFQAESPHFSTFVLAVNRPVFEVVDHSVSATELAPGESVTVEAKVRNDGAAAGEADVPLTIDGEVVATESVRLEPGEAATVEFAHSFDHPGEFEVAIEGESMTVQIVDDTPDERTATPSPTEEQPGFGPVLAIVVLLSAALLAARRRR